jgi:multicomponent Na+:H+ antiporter subunit B
MIPSLLLRTTTRGLFPLMLVFSVFLLIRGHNEPGGGFVGGLVAATAYVLVLAAEGLESARHVLRIHPLVFMGAGLTTALASAVVPMFAGRDFLTGMWLKVPLPVIGKLGTPFVFDTGVYLVVLGVTLTIVFELAEREP